TPVAVALARLSGPGGPLDILVATQADDKVLVLKNNGDGTFTEDLKLTLATGRFPTAIAVGDFNNDGNIDIVVAHNLPGGTNGTRGLTLFLGNGDRTFQKGKELISDGRIFASAIAVADFNKDGNADLVVADNEPTGKVALLLGNGDGTFQQPQFFNAVD